MSTGWTAPGAAASSDPGAPGTPEVADPSGTSSAPPPTSAPPAAPRRELDTSLPLFPLRPLGLGEILGAAMRIYRLHPRPVLALSATVYGIAMVLVSLITGAGMVPMVADMQAMMETPSNSVDGAFTDFTGTVLGTTASSLVTAVITLIASAVVAATLSRVAVDEAVGAGVGDIWATARRVGPRAVAVAVLTNLLGVLVLALAATLGALPLVLTQAASTPTVLALGLGVLIGVLGAVYVWARLLLALPVLAVEDTGVVAALRRSLALTAGSRLWRVLGIGVLLVVLYSIASQVVAGIFGTVGTVVYVVILLISQMEALVLGMAVLMVLSLLGAYVATFLLAPFSAAGVAALYADHRMRHEAYDIELSRRRRENLGSAR